MDDYISKPIDPSKLARVLSAWIASPAGKTDTNTEIITPSAPTATIDFGRLRDLFGDDPQLIGEILEMFRASTATLLGKLHLACAQHDAVAARALAHEAKGACSNLGMTAMAEHATRLEKATATADWTSIAEQCSALEATFQHLTLTIQTQRKEAS